MIYGNYMHNTVEPVSSSIVTTLIMASMVIIWLIFIAILVFTVIGMWKVFEKNKMPGWYAVIPGFNIWKYLELSEIPGWTMFLPYANVVFIFIASYRISIKMGKNMVFGIINAFYPFVGLMILGFSSAMPIDSKKDEKSQD